MDETVAEQIMEFCINILCRTSLCITGDLLFGNCPCATAVVQLTHQPPRSGKGTCDEEYKAEELLTEAVCGCNCVLEKSHFPTWGAQSYSCMGTRGFWKDQLKLRYLPIPQSLAEIFTASLGVKVKSVWVVSKLCFTTTPQQPDNLSTTSQAPAKMRCTQPKHFLAP